MGKQEEEFPHRDHQSKFERIGKGDKADAKTKEIERNREKEETKIKNIVQAIEAKKREETRRRGEGEEAKRRERESTQSTPMHRVMHWRQLEVIESRGGREEQGGGAQG